MTGPEPKPRAPRVRKPKAAPVVYEAFELPAEIEPAAKIVPGPRRRPKLTARKQRRG